MKVRRREYRFICIVKEHRKELRRIFPCNDKMVLIIDDRSDVWDGCKNLIPVQPFVFFEGSEQGYDVATTSTSFLKNIDDDQLPKVLNVLQNVHKQFFASDPETRDVKRILSGMKGHLFHGLQFVFSGCFPIGGGELRPSQQAIWREAELWGANCSESLSASTTHLITTRSDTEKVEQAQQKGKIHIVHPSWMYASMVNWTRLPETLYAVQLLAVPFLPWMQINLQRLTRNWRKFRMTAVLKCLKSTVRSTIIEEKTYCFW